MNKRVDFIDIIKENASEPQCRQLLEDLYKYYKINDMDTGNVHGEVFHALYLEDHPTYDDISETCFVSLCTLHRYRLKFNELAIRLAPSELKRQFNLSEAER